MFLPKGLLLPDFGTKHDAVRYKLYTCFGNAWNAAEAADYPPAVYVIDSKRLYADGVLENTNGEFFAHTINDYIIETITTDITID